MRPHLSHLDATPSLSLHSVLVGAVTEAGTSSTGSDGSAIFIGGVSGGSATNFSSVRVSLDSAAVDRTTDFAINQADFSPVPEPTSLALVGMTTAGACGYFWQRQRKLRQKA
jgi:hypothetical protein